MHSRGKALVLATFAVAAVLLWESRGDGPDFGHYFEWGRAAVSADIFELDGDILAIGGVPLSQWSAAPGMLFAATYYAAGERLELRTAAYLTGWAAAMLFWVSAVAALRVAGRHNPGIVAFGAGVLFVGTHAGLYSHTYSTELLASALIAVTWAIALSRTGRGILASTAVAAVAGLLLFITPLSRALRHRAGVARGLSRIQGPRTRHIVTQARDAARRRDTARSRGRRVGGGESLDDGIAVSARLRLSGG